MYGNGKATGGNWAVSDFSLKTTKTAGAVTKPISFVPHLISSPWVYAQNSMLKINLKG